MSKILEKFKKNRLAVEIFSIAVLILAWWVISLNFIPRVLPGPVLVFNLVIQNFTEGNAMFHLGRTLIRLLVGFFVGFGIGMGLGVLMGIRRFWGNFFGIITVIGLAFPSLVWAVLSVMWFGVSEMVAYIPITLIIFPIVTVNIREGTKAVDKSLIEMAQAFRVNKLSIIRRVYIPMLMPYIMGTMRFAFSTAWKIVTITEVFGLTSGVGYMLAYWYHELYAAQVFAWALIFVIVVIFIEKFIFVQIDKKVFKWRPEAKL